MKTSVHLSDDALKSVALENAASEVQSQVEEHVTDCPLCQNRLLELAVDDKWRNNIVQNCQTVKHEVENTASEIFSSTASDASPTGDAFDLQTVDQMLGQFLEPPTHPEMLGRLGRYDIEGVIGCGGMGVVLRGFDRDLFRPVAVKMILPRHSKNGTAKQRFAREARAAAVVLHPNVIPIYGIESTNDVPWIAMPLIVGPTLKVLVEEHGPLPEREIVRIGKQVASGLAAAHSQGLVHRDIKPENIMVDNQVNRVIITDFGLARRLSDEPMTQTGFLAGTIGYMSPEQSRGAGVDARSDLFSLGGLMYFLATGHSPFSSSSPMGVVHAISNEPHVRVQALNNEISAALATVIDRLLEKDAGKRYQSAVELEAILSDYLLHLQQPLYTPMPASLQTEKPGPKPNVSVSKYPWNLVLVAFGLLAALGVWWGGSAWQGLPEQSTRQDSPFENSPSPTDSNTRSPFAKPPVQDELDKKLDQWLEEHGVAWNGLRDEPELTVEKIEAVRQKTIDKFPPLSEFQPRHIRRIKNAGLLQSGPARGAAIQRLKDFENDESAEASMAAYMLFDFAVEIPMSGYREKETKEERLIRQQKALANFLQHPRFESVFMADRQLQFFFLLHQMNSPDTWKKHREKLLRAKELMIASQQDALHSEYSDCFDVLKVAAELEGSELEELRKELLDFAKTKRQRLETMKVIKSQKMHEHYLGSLAAQIRFLETVRDRGSLIGSPAPELTFLWSSQPKIKSWAFTKGKVCVLYFSTANCGPCVKSVPKLIQLNKTIAEHGHMAELVNFIGITSQQGVVPLKENTVDCEDDFEQECKLTLKYIEETGINWPVVFTQESVYNAAYGVRGVPHMVILNDEGVICDMFNPFEEKLENMIKRIGLAVK